MCKGERPERLREGETMEQLSEGARYMLSVGAFVMFVICLGVGLVVMLRDN
jgi:hypothetical protein